MRYMSLLCFTAGDTAWCDSPESGSVLMTTNEYVLSVLRSSSSRISWPWITVGRRMESPSCSKARWLWSLRRKLKSCALLGVLRRRAMSLNTGADFSKMCATSPNAMRVGSAAGAWKREHWSDSMRWKMRLTTWNDHARQLDPSNIVPSIKGSPKVATSAGAAHMGRGFAPKSDASDSPFRCSSTSRSRSMLNMESTRSRASPAFASLSSEALASMRIVRTATVRAIMAGCEEENTKNAAGSMANLPLALIASDLITAPGTASTYVSISPFCFESALHLTDTATRTHRSALTRALASPKYPRTPTPPAGLIRASPSDCFSRPRPLPCRMHGTPLDHCTRGQARSRTLGARTCSGE